VKKDLKKGVSSLLKSIKHEKSAEKEKMSKTATSVFSFRSTLGDTHAFG